MEIVLRNGEKINLDWNPIVLEYLEEYEGGIEQLKKDVENKNYRFRAFNFTTYCLISAVYPKELTYKDAISLVNINDLDRIVVFIVQNINNIKLAETINDNERQNINKRSHLR